MGHECRTLCNLFSARSGKKERIKQKEKRECVGLAGGGGWRKKVRQRGRLPTDGNESGKSAMLSGVPVTLCDRIAVL